MILHEKRYLIKAMKRNIKYLFDLFFTWLLRKLLLFRGPQSFHHSSLVKEAENDQRNNRSQQQIKHTNDQNRNQCDIHSEEPHRWRVQDIFQHRHSKQQRNHSTNDVCTSGIVDAFINHQPLKLAICHTDTLHSRKLMATGNNIGDDHICKVNQSCQCHDTANQTTYNPNHTCNRI